MQIIYAQKGAKREEDAGEVEPRMCPTMSSIHPCFMQLIVVLIFIINSCIST